MYKQHQNDKNKIIPIIVQFAIENSKKNQRPPHSQKKNMNCISVSVERHLYSTQQQNGNSLFIGKLSAFHLEMLMLALSIVYCNYVIIDYE